MISYLDILQEQYVMCPIDKATNNIAFISRKYCVPVLLKELGLLNTTSDSYVDCVDVEKCRFRV